MKCSGGKPSTRILRGIFQVVSGFPLHFMLHRGHLDCFSNSVHYTYQNTAPLLVLNHTVIVQLIRNFVVNKPSSPLIFIGIDPYCYYLCITLEIGTSNCIYLTTYLHIMQPILNKENNQMVSFICV